MSKSIPSYLRLHVEDVPVQPPSGIPRLDELCTTFEQITGWSLQVSSKQAQTGSGTGSVDFKLPDGESDAKLVVESLSSVPSARQERTTRDAALAHAKAIAGLLNQLNDARGALWRREAELAAGVPVVEHAAEELHLAARLQAVLKGGAEAVQCDAAALYMLDEDTSRLKLRAGWGLNHQRYLDPARPLRDALADLEALLGNAVVLEDTSMLPHWNAPDGFSAAVCVPVSTPTTLLGTLWMFADSPRDFTSEQTNLIEIIAGRVATDLEREMLLHHAGQTKELDRQVVQAAQWQHQRLPTIKPLFDDWDVAGWTSQAGNLGGAFFDWSVTRDGRLAAILGDVNGSSIDAALTAACVQTAVRSHAVHRHGTRQLVENVNETIWTTSAGDSFASLFYGLVDAGRSIIEFTSAGNIDVVRLGNKDNQLLSIEGPPLGVQPESSYREGQTQLEANEVMVVLSAGAREALSPTDETGTSNLLNCLQLDHHLMTAEEVLEAVRSMIEEKNAVCAAADRTVLVIRRQR